MSLLTARSSKQGIRAVAERAGVSIATVSRAINKPESVSASLRARIAQAIDAVGYIPHAPARILSSRRSRTLGAIVPTIDNTMFARGIASLQSYLSSVGYMLFLTTTGYDLDVELQQARNLVSRGVDGLVLRGDCHHDALRKMLADNAVPFINVGIYRPDRPYPCVGTNNEAAAYRAAMHVIELGHRRIGIVSALQRNNDRASARVAGFRRALADSSITLPPQWHVEVPYALDDAREAARYLLSLEERPTAVVCGNDVIAYGVLLEAERSGFSVPRDLSVVGFDDLDWSRHLRPSLTTIHVPTGETWQRAGEFLVRHLAGEQTIMHHEVYHSLVVRESTAPPSRSAK
ncbi:LacI family DNA-binding transcriptional regulator [Bradyrhizobium sp. LHD-71]|uniref:LacI family DNA-binding transcriptional regulator n=1 Tax=Bradyrhizobium sp. LHD-71 TaxID=3072141 RepID=UPI00280E61A3|nr:LacI family DNA-binding transcriptional regulator [Bradyrhizobium sp. LHD-71]MDQ8728464.1 LacI family DNA-binding transcriptional regulator [Bradyrhizobium sp. LHD-71]